MRQSTNRVRRTGFEQQKPSCLASQVNLIELRSQPGPILPQLPDQLREVIDGLLFFQRSQPDLDEARVCPGLRPEAFGLCDRPRFVSTPQPFKSHKVTHFVGVDHPEQGRECLLLHAKRRQQSHVKVVAFATRERPGPESHVHPGREACGKEFGKNRQLISEKGSAPTTQDFGTKPHQLREGHRGSLEPHLAIGMTGSQPGL